MDDTFAAQYKNPLWQKKRLEAMEEADFKCQMCFGSEEQLHVHHKRYIKGRRIWEYDNNELVVLCHECHEIVHHEQEVLKRTIALIDVMAIEEIIGLIAGYCSEAVGPVGAADMSDTIEYVSREYGEQTPPSVAAGKAAARMVVEYYRHIVTGSEGVENNGQN